MIRTRSADVTSSSAAVADDDDELQRRRRRRRARGVAEASRAAEILFNKSKSVTGKRVEGLGNADHRVVMRLQDINRVE